MFNIFKRKKELPKKRENKLRSFFGARVTRMNNFHESFARINQDIRNDYIALTLRARALYQNNQIVASYVNYMIRNVIGTGFRLNCMSYNVDGNSDVIANEAIQEAWLDYTRSYKKYVSADCQMNQIQFDKHLLFNLILDGQAYIRKVKDVKSKYGIRFQLIDSLDIDPLYNVQFQQDGTKIVMGIKVDEHYKPLKYYIRKSNSANYYLSGQRVQVDADEIIHIYKKQYPNQVRGFTGLCSILLTLNSLDEYKRSQVNASILASSYMGIWQQTGGDSAIDQYNEDQVDEHGDVALQLQSNVFRYAPKNCTLKQIQATHPNSNISTFWKSMLKGLCGALGISYNKIGSDVSQTSYSSLRQANIEDGQTIKELQNFLILNWKDVQYAEFLKYLLISDLVDLPFSKIDKFMAHQFRGQQKEYLDPVKEAQAIQMRLQMGLISPIQAISDSGRDPYYVADSWKKWKQILADRDLKMSETYEIISNVDDNTTIQQQIQE